jgi:DNA repair exonuclease SbcCD ATPase subunit
MSAQDFKTKHSQRRYQSECKQLEQQKIAKLHGIEDTSKHYYNKHHALDCGNPQCPVCGNPRRTHKHTLTYQEQKFYQYIEDCDDNTSTSRDPKDQP